MKVCETRYSVKQRNDKGIKEQNHMLRNAVDVESGCLSASDRKRMVMRQRAGRLMLNKYRDVQSRHVNGVNSVDLDPVEQRYLLSGGSDGGIAIHDMLVNKREIRHTCPLIHYQRRCFFDSSRSRRFRAGGHTHSVETVQWFPLDNGMFTTSSFDKSLKFWDTNKMTVADCYTMDEIVYSHHMSPTATHHNLCAVGTKSPKVFLVDPKSGSKTHTLQSHNNKVVCVCWSSRDEYLLSSGSADHHIYLWDVRAARGPLLNLDRFNTSNQPDKLKSSTSSSSAPALKHSSSPASSLKHSSSPLSSSLKHSSSSLKRKVKDVTNGVRHGKAHSAQVSGLCFTTDGSHLLSFGTDFKLRLWDVSSGRHTGVNYGSVLNYSKRKVQLTVSDDYAFVPTQQVISVYDLVSGTRLKSPLNGRLSGHFNDVNCVYYDDREGDVYSGGDDRNILIWSYEDQSEDRDYDEYVRSRVDDHAAANGMSALVVEHGDAWSSDDDNGDDIDREWERMHSPRL